MHRLRKSFVGIIFASSILSCFLGCGVQTGRQANAGTPTSESVQPAKTIMLIDREDPDMQRAIRMARREVDDFLIALVQPRPDQTDFAVKVAFGKEEVIEHLWLVDLKYVGGVLIGKLASTPQELGEFVVGEIYGVTPEEVTDWYYFDEEEMVGGYTVKLLLERSNGSIAG